MERKVFLRNSLGFLGMAIVIPTLLKAAGAADPPDTIESDEPCSLSPSETAGPFPTITPSTFVRTDIVDGREGVPFTINVNVMNKNANCTALQNAIVDIWHCDKDGNYSEYGGSGMQQTNYTSAHFLRGRQVTNNEGRVSFTSIFPGWYTGRATHIHVHIYSETGTSLLITQISFPEGSGSAVQLVNASTLNGYTKGMNGYTYKENDNVFSDDSTNAELAIVSGTVEDGYNLEHIIYVNGPVLATSQASKPQYKLEQNYPNPFTDNTIIPLSLEYDSDVTIAIYDLTGRKVLVPQKGKMSAGNNDFTLNRGDLASGYYIYKVSVKNQNGSFEESKKMIVK